MAQSKKKFREIVFQLLYSRSFEGTEGELSLVVRQNAVPKKVGREAKEAMDAVWEKGSELDVLIAAKAHGYELERISRIERSILRLGLYELLYTELPGKVVIAEAIRLARKFSTAEGGKFVNAILDAIYKERGDASLSEKQTTC